MQILLMDESEDASSDYRDGLINNRVKERERKREREKNCEKLLKRRMLLKELAEFITFERNVRYC